MGRRRKYGNLLIISVYTKITNFEGSKCLRRDLHRNWYFNLKKPQRTNNRSACRARAAETVSIKIQLSEVLNDGG